MKDSNKRIAVVVASHKEYRMPKDSMYVPLYVGACRDKEEKVWSREYRHDNKGENISFLNPSFCELTGLYWAWKNLDADFVGLVHYRRHFCMKKKSDPFDAVLKEAEIGPLLDSKKIFVPKKRKYYIESLYSHYAHTHFAVQLDTAREIIKEQFPAYLDAYDQTVKQTGGYMFNMMIMRKELLNDYCDWLFSILFAMMGKLGARAYEPDPALAGTILDIAPEDGSEMPELSDFQARFYGRVSEILFNVWLAQKISAKDVSSDEIYELGYINLEGENWGKKISSFLKAKYGGEKYEQSF